MRSARRAEPGVRGVSSLAYVICEAQDGGPWRAEARFLVSSGRDLRALLEGAGLADRGHPPDLSATVRGDLVMEDRPVSGHTALTAADLAVLVSLTSPAEQPRLRAWQAFAGALEASERSVRLIVWFVG